MNQKRLKRLALLSALSCAVMSHIPAQANPVAEEAVQENMAAGAAKSAPSSLPLSSRDVEDVSEKKLPTFDFETVVVTATATPIDSIMKTNAAVNIITREEIQEKHYQSLHEIIENIPGYNGFVTANGVGFEMSATTRPYTRGTERTIIMVDGIKQDFGGRIFGNTVVRNVNDIERVEFVKGTSSTLYGADAVGGVINIITRSHYDKPKTRLSLAAGNFSTQNYQVDNSGEAGNSFWSVSALRRHQGDYKDAKSATRPQEANSSEIDLKYGYHLDKRNDIILKYVNHDEWRNYVEGRVLGNDSECYGKFRYNTTTAIWNAKSDNGKWGNTLAYYRGSLLNDRGWDSWSYIQQNGKVKKYAAGSERSRHKTWSITEKYYNQLTENNRLSAGIDIFNLTTEAMPSPAAKTTPYSKDRLRERSIYLQDEWNITDKLKFTAGARWANPDIAKSRFLPSLDLGYSFNDNAMMYISSKAYMAYPYNIYLLGNGRTTATAIYRPLGKLIPYTGTTNEIGGKIKLGNSLYFDIAYYQRKQKHSIANRSSKLSDGRTLYEYYNIEDSSKFHGIELNLVKKFGKHFTATLGYNHLTADTETLINYQARDTYTIDLKYKQKKYSVGINGIGRLDIARSSSWISDDYKPSDYWNWNLYANYEPAKQVRVWARINNLFNKFYYYPFNFTATDQGRLPRYYTGPGRSFLVGVDFTF